MSAYLLGLVTIPGAALVGYALLLVVRLVIDAWPEWKPEIVGENAERRAAVAGAFVLCRRYFEVVLPFGFIVVFRSRLKPAPWTHTPAAKVAMAIRTTVREINAEETP